MNCAWPNFYWLFIRLTNKGFSQILSSFSNLKDLFDFAEIGDPFSATTGSIKSQSNSAALSDNITRLNELSSGS